MLAELGTYLKELGDSAFLIADEVVWGLVGEQVQNTLRQANVQQRYEKFNGEASGNEISRLASVAQESGSAVVVGLGGGKTLDTAKAVADELHAPVVIVPTAASTDAPCSALSVIYSDSGVFESYRFIAKPRSGAGGYTGLRAGAGASVRLWHRRWSGDLCRGAGGAALSRQIDGERRSDDCRHGHRPRLRRDAAHTGLQRTDRRGAKARDASGGSCGGSEHAAFRHGV